MNALRKHRRRWLIAVGVLALLLAVLFTQAGLRLLVMIATSASQGRLAVDGVEGAIPGPVTFLGVRLHLATASVEIDRVTLSALPSVSLDGHWRLSPIVADSVAVDLHPNETAQPDDTVTRLVHLDLERLHIGKLTVSRAGEPLIDLRRLAAHVAMTQRELALPEVAATTDRVRLAGSARWRPDDPRLHAQLAWWGRAGALGRVGGRLHSALGYTDIALDTPVVLRAGAWGHLDNALIRVHGRAGGGIHDLFGRWNPPAAVLQGTSRSRHGNASWQAGASTRGLDLRGVQIDAPQGRLAGGGRVGANGLIDLLLAGASGEPVPGRLVLRVRGASVPRSALAWSGALGFLRAAGRLWPVASQQLLLNRGAAELAAHVSADFDTLATRVHWNPAAGALLGGLKAGGAVLTGDWETVAEVLTTLHRAPGEAEP